MRLLASSAIFLLTCFSLIACCAGVEPQEGWTRFRGPNGTGVFTGCKVPIPWNDRQVQWRISLPGEGHGSPVIWKNQFFLMSANPADATRYLISGEVSSGKILWKKDFPSVSHRLHALSSYASSTPCVDAKRVYFAWASPDSLILMAFTHQGELVWTRDLGRYVTDHGFGTSPTIVDGLLILANSQDIKDLQPGVLPGKDTLIALNADTGSTVWETERTASVVCYGVPCVTTDARGKKILLTANSGDGVAAYDAQTGTKIWSKMAFDKRVVSSPVLAGNLVLSAQGSGNGGNVLVAMKTDGHGEVAFRIDRSSPYVPCPVVVGDQAFLWDDKGVVTCVHLPDGKPVWMQRVGGDVSTSPIVVNDKLIGISHDGVVTILAVANKFQKLAQYDLDAVCRSTPAVDEEHLLIRTASQLICIGTGK